MNIVDDSETVGKGWTALHQLGSSFLQALGCSGAAGSCQKAGGQNVMRPLWLYRMKFELIDGYLY